MYSLLQDFIAIGSGFFVTLLLSLLITKLSIKILPKIGFVDDNLRDDRRIHTGRIATSGGVAIFLSFAIGLFLSLIFLHPKSYIGLHTLYLLIPAVFVVIFGICDDKFEFKPRTKLAFQIIVAIICFVFDIRVDSVLGIILPFYLAFPLTVIWVLACINGFNLIDGIDGLAAGLGVISSLTMGIFLFAINMPEESMIMFLLCASCLGFLKFNFKNAKIFMGEAGSGFIGVTFAIVSMSSSGKLTTLSFLIVPLLAFGLPFFDTLLAISRRFLRQVGNSSHSSIFTADKSHIHHRLLAVFKNQNKATVLLYLVSFTVCFLSLCLVFVKDYNQFIVVLVLVVAIVAITKSLSFVETSSFLDYILGLTRKSKFLRLLLFLDTATDFIFIGLASYLSSYLFDIASPNKHILEICISLASYGVIFFGFKKLRKIYWAKSTLSQFFYLVKALFTFSLLMLIVDYYLLGKYLHYYSRVQFYSFIGENILNFSLIILLILTKKLVIKWVGEIGIRIASSTCRQATGEIKRTLIYSSDIVVKFFRDDLVRSNSAGIEVVGIMTNSPVLAGKIVYGYKVLGSLRNIDSLVKNYGVNSILITTDIRKRDLIYLKSYCQKNNIEIKKIMLDEQKV